LYRSEQEEENKNKRETNQPTNQQQTNKQTNKQTKKKKDSNCMLAIHSFNQIKLAEYEYGGYI